MKVQEIAELHDEAFWHLHQYDGHAKSSDGYIGFEVNFGTVWDRREGPVTPRVGVRIYSYVVASETPLYPSFGDRQHWFETLDEALDIMREWHRIAMGYSPSAKELAEIDEFALQLWDVIKDKTTIIEVDEDGNTKERRNESEGRQALDS